MSCSKLFWTSIWSFRAMVTSITRFFYGMLRSMNITEPAPPSPVLRRLAVGVKVQKLAQAASQVRCAHTQDEAYGIHDIALATAIRTDDGGEVMKRSDDGDAAIRFEILDLQTHDASITARLHNGIVEFLFRRRSGKTLVGAYALCARSSASGWWVLWSATVLDQMGMCLAVRDMYGMQS